MVIAGGSEGLGRAVAEAMVKEGAESVTIWARRQKAINQAVEELQSVAKSGNQQTIVVGKTVDVTDFDQVRRAINGPEECADIVFCCAGTANIISDPLTINNNQ